MIPGSIWCDWCKAFMFLLQALGPGIGMMRVSHQPDHPREQSRERVREAMRAIPGAWHLPRLHTLRLGALMFGADAMAAFAAAELPALRSLQLQGMHAAGGPLDPSPLLLPLSTASGSLKHLGLNCGDVNR